MRGYYGSDDDDDGYGGYYTNWRNIIYEPFKGFDAKRFPNTFMTMLLLYYNGDWYRSGVWKNGSYPDFIKNPVKSLKVANDGKEEI